MLFSLAFLSACRNLVARAGHLRSPHGCLDLRDVGPIGLGVLEQVCPYRSKVMLIDECPHDRPRPFRRPTKVPNKYGGSSVPQHLEAVAVVGGRVAVRIPFACVYCQRAFDLQRIPERLVNIRHPFDIPAAIPENKDRVAP